ncbi:MAG TPA: carboxypeptidase regulatory-like domain-containing protein, partial [Pyrinomonadaceae bacterium]
LESAQLILLLVSADFLASDYCYEVEMMRALERQKEGTARVIPIILRNCDWSSAPFSRLQALPENAKPIKSWGDQDEAYQDVVAGIREAVAQITGAPRVRQARVEILAGGLTRRQTASLTLIGTLIMLGVFLGLMLRSSTTLQTANAPSTPAATTPESRNSPETLMLSGFVVDSKDRAVQGAKVTINEMPTMEPVETTSDGRFIINGVPKQYGQWVRIRVVKEGYFPNPYEENYLLGSTPTTIQLRRAK